MPIVVMILSLVVFALSAPFLFNKYDEGSFWSFNRDVVLGAFIAIIAGIILCAGSSAALASINYLFELKISHKPYLTIWSFGAIILSPLYALSFVPGIFQVKAQDCEVSKQHVFIVNWIMAPLVGVYMVILYAYFIKMGITGNVPKGQLAYMITGYSLAGIVTYLMSWVFIFKGQGNSFLKNLTRWFFPLMAVPVLVLFYAVYLRINQYGVTEDRYMLGLITIWLGFLVIGFSFKKLLLKHILLSLSLLLFFSAWGPWGMASVSNYSQFSRLERLLVKNNLLQEGKIIKAQTQGSVSLEDKVEISSRVSYLVKNNKKNFMLYGHKTNERFFDAVGFEEVKAYHLNEERMGNGSNHFSLSVTKTYGRIVDLNGADFYIQDVFLNSGRNYELSEPSLGKLVLKIENNNVLVTIGESEPITLSLKNVLIDLASSMKNSIKLDTPPTIEGQSNKYEVKIKVYGASGYITNQNYGLKQLNGRIFIYVR